MCTYAMEEEDGMSGFIFQFVNRFFVLFLKHSPSPKEIVFCKGIVEK